MSARLTQEEINRRHMLAMGLDPDTLGKPYTTPSSPLSDAMRCPEVYDGLRCVRPVGHPGRHVRGTTKWGGDEEVNDHTAGGAA